MRRLALVLLSAVLLTVLAVPAFAQTTISGQVTSSGTGIAGVSVIAFPIAGGSGPATVTDANGNYTIPGLTPGTSYRVITANLLGYVDEQYNNVQCIPGGCSPGLSHSPQAAGATGINFDLTVGGRISGTVTGGGSPLASVLVNVRNAQGLTVSTTNTNAAGQYQFPALPIPVSYSVHVADVGFYMRQQTSLFTLTGDQPGTNFNLVQGGRISGVVTSASTGAPLSGISLIVYDANGTLVGGVGGVTSGTGTFATALLAPGSYYLQAQNFQGFIDKVWQNLPCTPNCVVTQGSNIVVTAGQTNANTNFALDLQSRITGTVTNAATGGALLGVAVQVFNSAGTLVTTAFPTSNGGAYATGHLAPGTYYVRTQNSLGFLDRGWQNLPCTPSCVVTQGNQLTIVAGQAIENINFALTLAGRITGTIRDAGTGVGIGGVTVQVFNAAGTQVTSINTSTQAATLGTYTTAALADGSYFVRTTNNLGYINQLHSGQPCAPNCTVTTGTPVAVTAPNLATVDFNLTVGARISGTVTDDNGGAPIGGVTVQLFNSSGVSVIGSGTVASGTYNLSGLAPGTYYLRTFNTLGYLDEAYNNIVCLSCQLTTTGVPIVLTSGEQRVIPIGLARGAQVTGRVTDAGGTGLGQVTITVFDVTGRQLVVTTTSSAASTLGNYATSGVPEGAVFVRAVPPAGTPYIAEVFDNLPCMPCRVIDGTPIPVTTGIVTPNINFALEAGGRISGSVTDDGTGAPITGIAVDVITSSGGTLLTATTNAAGAYTTPGLPAGSYFARTRVLSTTPAQSLGYISVVFDDIACSGCNPVTGTPIPVTPGQIAGNINFALDQGGRVAGRVRDAAMQGLAGIVVRVYSSGGLQASATATSANGEYLLPDGLAAGTYYVRTDNALYVDALYNGLLCTPGCTPTSGTGIAVSTGVTGGVDFTLEPAGRIAGTITDAQGQPLSGITASVLNQAGVTVASGLTDASGAYLTDGLVPGDYYVRTINSVGLINEVHKLPAAEPCLGCDPQISGTAITVAAGATTGGIDFSLDAGARVSGTVTASGGAPLAGVIVDLYVGQATKPATGGTTNALGVYVTRAGLPAGTVIARTGNSLGYANQQNDQVVVNPPSTTANIDFTLSPDLDTDGDGILSSIDTSPASSPTRSPTLRGGGPRQARLSCGAGGPSPSPTRARAASSRVFRARDRERPSWRPAPSAGPRKSGSTLRARPSASSVRTAPAAPRSGPSPRSRSSSSGKRSAA